MKYYLTEAWQDFERFSVMEKIVVLLNLAAGLIEIIAGRFLVGFQSLTIGFMFFVLESQKYDMKDLRETNRNLRNQIFNLTIKIITRLFRIISYRRKRNF